MQGLKLIDISIQPQQYMTKHCADHRSVLNESVVCSFFRQPCDKLGWLELQGVRGNAFNFDESTQTFLACLV